MVSNLNTRQAFNRSPEMEAVTHVGDTAHGGIGCIVTVLIGLAYCTIVIEASASYRRELLSLSDNLYYSGGIYGTSDSVNNYGSHGHLTFIGFSAGLTVD